MVRKVANTLSKALQPHAIPARVIWWHDRPFVHMWEHGGPLDGTVNHRDAIRQGLRHGVPHQLIDAAELPHEGQPLRLVFLFHTSRCGSTLVSRLLGCHPDVLVLSEPSFVSDIMCLDQVDEAARLDLRFDVA